ncbi:MAG: hypothetical protein NTY46_11065 [Candidatus Sumerlaeota bacterium]|nr:hypothetical protein [Candidatus Sumerlaeota bacterium]
MSFVYQDLGIFPKLCWLRFNLPSLIAEMNGLGLAPDTAVFNTAFEYHSNNVPNLYSKLQAKWRGSYIALNPERSVKIQFPGYGGTGMADWQADAWGNPYMAYFIHTVPSATVGAQPTLRFLASAQEKADYFAGIVSYGRNHVPGLGDFPAQSLIDDRRNNRSLYKGTGPNIYQSLVPSEYNQARLEMILLVTPSPFPATEPRIRDVGSDDRVVEF